MPFRYETIEEVDPIEKSDISKFDFIHEIEKANPYHDRLGRFTTASGATGFVPAGTIQEAREFAKNQLGFSGTVDYSYSYIDQKEVKQVSGTLDLDTVNSINKNIAEIQAKYPETKGYVKDLVCTNANVYAAVVHTGRDATPILAIGAKAYKDGTATVNKNWADDVELGYHPEGTTGDSVLWHEYGHVYSSIANRKAAGPYASSREIMGNIASKKAESGWKSEAVKKIMNDSSAKKDYESKGLEFSEQSVSSTFGQNISRYATSGDDELFAEAFAAYNSGSTNIYANAIIEAAGADRR